MIDNNDNIGGGDIKEEKPGRTLRVSQFKISCEVHICTSLHHCFHFRKDKDKSPSLTRYLISSRSYQAGAWMSVTSRFHICTCQKEDSYEMKNTIRDWECWHNFSTCTLSLLDCGFRGDNQFNLCWKFFGMLLLVQVPFKGSQGVERHPLAGTYFKSVSACGAWVASSIQHRFSNPWMTSDAETFTRISGDDQRNQHFTCTSSIKKGQLRSATENSSGNIFPKWQTLTSDEYHCEQRLIWI